MQTTVIAILALCLVASCTKDNYEPEQTTETTKIDKVVTISYAGPVIYMSPAGPYEFDVPYTISMMLLTDPNVVYDWIVTEAPIVPGTGVVYNSPTNGKLNVTFKLGGIYKFRARGRQLYKPEVLSNELTIDLKNIGPNNLTLKCFDEAVKNKDYDIENIFDHRGYDYKTIVVTPTDAYTIVGTLTPGGTILPGQFPVNGEIIQGSGPLPPSPPYRERLVIKPTKSGPITITAKATSTRGFPTLQVSKTVTVHESEFYNPGDVRIECFLPQGRLIPVNLSNPLIGQQMYTFNVKSSSSPLPQKFNWRLVNAIDGTIVKDYSTRGASIGDAFFREGQFDLIAEEAEGNSTRKIRVILSFSVSMYDPTFPVILPQGPNIQPNL